MITNEVMGRRLREVRCQLELTLKNVETLSGLSSTHISEIERGMTSPTIGALIRIAHALKKDPSYFIEERKLDEVCVTSEGDRPAELIPKDVRIENGRIESLTRGVICGRIRSYELRLEPGGRAELSWLHEGHDACFYCIEGKTSVRIGSLATEMSPGDSIHGPLSGVPVIEADRMSAGRMVVILDPREESC